MLLLTFLTVAVACRRIHPIGTRAPPVPTFHRDSDIVQPWSPTGTAEPSGEIPDGNPATEAVVRRGEAAGTLPGEPAPEAGSEHPVTDKAISTATEPAAVLLLIKPYSTSSLRSRAPRRHRHRMLQPSETPVED
ncbi:hypothetical protein POF50_008655 [Streptomyces sp. SL13]|uniref:Uncharacterized protein n=1 Tax=Streptantibioticus silvisoli TaxID=2705255 RepID=A0AA90H7J4_9ACTN|nr:hypothetical protein [Streptantibioticus silvisoli]MDI5969412.1 hypothetical protein [Streptantibioticus silvisoli]